MTRALLILRDSDTSREKARDWCARLPEGSRVEFKKPRRSLPQNDKMWALLTDLSEQADWHGRKLSTEVWKLVMLSGLRSELTFIPNYSGDGVIPIGYSSSDLSVEEMSALIEFIYAFGAERGVAFSEPRA